MPPDPIFCKIWNWPSSRSRPMFGSCVVMGGSENSTVTCGIVYAEQGAMNESVPVESSIALHGAILGSAGFRHAFFTREGGVSLPPWDTLSFAVSVGDDAAAVRENFARAARHLGVDADRLFVLSQVHGTAHRVLGRGDDRDAVVRCEGDITISREEGVACGVRSADCV